MKIPNKAVIRFEYNDEVKEYFFEMKELNDIIKEKQQRIDNAIEILENIYMLDNVEITNNAIREIDKAIDILKGSDKDEFN